MQQNNENFSATATQKPNSSKKDNSFEELTKIGKKMVRNDKINVGDGEIVQVPGGHIIRATGGKDRHSKVYTSKGPRDRRVRLSANTAIQFYDVQDRLGYDRPSKAVDWLMKQAKDAIDKLEDDSNKEIKMDSKSVQEMDLEHLEQQQESANIRYAIELQRHLSGNMATPTTVTHHHESMADSMKSFFPLNPGTSLMEMQSYTNNHDQETINSRIRNQSEDLGLLLQPQNQRAQTNQELLLHHHHHHHHNHNHNPNPNNPVTFEQNYQKPESWNNNLSVQEENNRVGFIFDNPNSISQQIFSINQNPSSSSSSSAVAADHQISHDDHQREPLQSNYSNLIHSTWNHERMLPSVNQQNPQNNSYNLYFGSNFQAQEQIHGDHDEEEDHSHCSQR